MNAGLVKGTRRDFLGALAAFSTVAGNVAFAGKAGSERLKVGILSDIHVTMDDNPAVTAGNADTFEKALRYFSERGADAVLVAGDLVDAGLKSELVRFAECWRKVFPDDKRPDGGHVEKIFIYGNHDADGCRWTGYAKGKLLTEADRTAMGIGYGDNRARFWRELFGEEYSPIYIKDVKGYKFVARHWDASIPKTAVRRFLEEHRSELAGSKPFFYTQHNHPKGTCSAPWVWGQDDGISTQALSAFPNAVAFSGHSHTSLTDDRTLWRGAFTSVGTASLRYIIPFGGRENSRIFDSRREKPEQMPWLECLDGSQGQFMTVYDDCIVLERRDFANDLPAGPDWVVPLPARGESFAERSGKFAVPQFAADAAVDTKRINGRNRVGKPTPQICVRFPNVKGGGDSARAFDFEVAVELREVDTRSIWMTKRVFSPHFYRAAEKDAEKVECLFALSELPSPNGRLPLERGRRWRFCVSPADCYGRHGKPIRSEWMSE